MPHVLDRSVFVPHFEAHNRRVRALFAHEPHRFLQIDLAADPSAVLKLCTFLRLNISDHPACLQPAPHCRDMHTPVTYPNTLEMEDIEDDCGIRPGNE